MAAAAADECPSEESLRAFAEGKLGQPEMLALRAHGASCGQCRARLESAPTLDGSNAVGLPALVRTASAERQLRPSDPLCGRYRIVQFLAAGGMGEVYEAWDEELKERVALKTIRAGLSQSQSVLERFKREVQLARRITHPNVCRVFDVARDDRDGAPLVFLTMELLRGESLAARIRRAGPLAPDEVRALVEDLAGGLQAAHALGIVHRDFKPENVHLVEREGRTRAVVTDFGLALTPLASDRPEEPPAETGPVHLIGTPAYLAPEQVEGGAITSAADVYALGVTIFHMLTGKLPFEGDTPLATAALRLSQPPPAPSHERPGLAPIWDEVVLRCLERAPEARYPSALAVARALTPRAPEPAPPSRPPWRRPWLVAALVALLGATATSGLYLARRTRVGALVPGEHRTLVAPAFVELGREPRGWVGAALATLLRDELTDGDRLTLVEATEATRAARQAGAEAGAGWPRIGRLGQAVHAQLALLGHLESDGTGLRVEAELWDTAEGRLLQRFDERGDERALPQLARRLGEHVRERLRLGPAQHAVGEQLRNPEALKAYAEALDRQAAYDFVGARAAIERGLAADPTSALLHIALADALDNLGFRDESGRQLELAHQHEDQLAPHERAELAAQLAEKSGQLERAAALYRELWKQRPESFGFPHNLAEVLARLGKTADAVAVVEALRKEGRMAGDPLLDLLEVDVSPDPAAQKRAAERALEAGRKTDQDAVVAEALYDLATSEQDSANTDRVLGRLDEARRIYRRLGNPRGEGLTLMKTAEVRLRQDRLDEALSAAREAIAQFRSIGDQANLATATFALGQVQIGRGQFGAAREALESVLHHFRQHGPPWNLAAGLSALGQVLRELGESQAALARLAEAVQALPDEPYLQLNAALGRAVAEEQLGELPACERDAAFALATAQKLPSQQDEALALTIQGMVERLRGHDQPARARLDQAVAVANALGNPRVAEDAQIELARLELARGQAEAALALGRALATRRPEGLALKALLLDALVATGQLAEAQPLGERIAERVPKEQSWRERAAAQLALAHLALAAHDGARALALLDPLVAEAAHKRDVRYGFDARLARAQALAHAGRAAEARALRAAVAREAQKAGYGFYAAR